MKTETEAVTILQAITEYIGSRELRAQSLARYRTLERSLPPAFLLHPVRGVVERDCRAALDSFADHPASYNKALSLLSAAFTLAVRNRLIDANPCQYIARKRVGRSHVDPLTPDELRRVIAATRDPWFANYFTVAAGTGLRSREITGLEWKAVDTDKRLIHVTRTARPDGSFGPPKTAGSARAVPMIASVAAALESQRLITGAREIIFANANGKPRALAAIAAVWRSSLAECGLSPRRLYETRHTFASCLLDSGAPIRDVAAVMGHSSTAQVIGVYSRWSRTPASLGSVFENAMRVA